MHASRWVTTHGYALNVDLDPAPFTEWITACGLEDAAVHVDGRASSAGRSPSTRCGPPPRRRSHEVFGLELEELPAERLARLGAARPRAVVRTLTKLVSNRPSRPLGARAAQPDRARRLEPMQTSLPVAERPRRPEWMKVRAPSADCSYFDVHKLLHGASLVHGLRGGALPEHRRVLGARHRDVPDPRRHLHARLPLLLRPLGQARGAARPARAAPPRAGGGADGALARRRHVGRPRRPPRPRRRALRGDDPRAQGEAARTRTVEVLTPDFLGVEEEALATVLGARPEVFNHNIETVRRLHRADARREGELRQGALAPPRARRRSPTTRVLTKSGIIVGLGETNDEVVETMRDLRAHGVDVVTIGQYLQPSPEARDDRPLGAPRRVPLVPRAGRGARLRLGLRRARSSARATAPTSSGTPPRPAAARSPTEHVGSAALATRCA